METIVKRCTRCRTPFDDGWVEHKRLCRMCTGIHYQSATRARRLVRQAVIDGTLTRPERCDICDEIPPQMADGRPQIGAHHAYGYSQPLKVWWLCRRCNGLLRGEKYHRGQVSMQEAKLVIRDFRSN